MSVKARRLSAALTTFLWIVWLAMCVASYVVEVGPGHLIAQEVIHTASITATIIVVLECIVGPLVATARLWHRIGAEQQRAAPCECSKNRVVIPMQRRSRVVSDN